MMQDTRSRNAELQCCPTCGRTFESVFDFPRVRVLAVEELPTLEAVDRFSPRAHEVQRERQQAGIERWYEAGVNRTPEVEAATQTAQMQKYLARLGECVGREIEPEQLRPDWESDGTFRRSYPIEGTQLFVSVHEAKPGEGEQSESDSRRADVVILCQSLNLGSGGGPTLQILGPIATIRYRGLLSPAVPAAGAGGKR